MNRVRIALDVSGVGLLENYRLDVARGVIRYARQHTDWELFYNLGDFSLVHRYDRFEDLVRLRARGIVFSYWEPEKVRAIRRLGIPMVSLSNIDKRLSRAIPCVVTDDHEVGRQAARHFLERGFRHFAAYCDIEGRGWEAERFAGYREVLAAASHQPARLERQPYHDPPRAARRLAAWVRSLPKPIAVFAGTDTRAFHVFEACREQGVDVPLQVAIVGVDNNPFICEAQHVALSSVAPDGERVGIEAAQLLDRLMRRHARAAKSPAPNVVVPPRGVVVRASSDVTAPDEAPVARALLFIRAHHAGAIGVDDIAAASGVSRRSLERRLRARLGLSINDALRQRRLETAKALLTDGTRSLEDVALLSGLRRATYLCNVFQQAEGCSPRAWQRGRSTGS